MEGIVDVTDLKELRTRLRNVEDQDIRQAMKTLGKLSQGELSNLIRDGMRLKLKERGVLNDRHHQNPKTNS